MEENAPNSKKKITLGLAKVWPQPATQERDRNNFRRINIFYYKRISINFKKEDDQRISAAKRGRDFLTISLGRASGGSSVGSWKERAGSWFFLFSIFG
jgi:hypothetical protein